jgi:tRNA pseudouridine38-40 synthase
VRIALGIEYQGSPFCGWERQRHCETVQSVLERALAVVANAPVATTCAGRTDSGVHALSQVAHFDTEAQRPDHAWVFGANANLPREVSVLWAQEIAPNFHARFSAFARRYTYFLLNKRSRPAVLDRRVTWERRPLDVDAMSQAADALVGLHDFSAYRASRCQSKSPIRRVHSLTIARHGDLIRVDILANAFLHHMVRNVVGVLVSIGIGEHDPSWAGDVLASRDRGQGGVTAPPDGLYLIGVKYPPEFSLLSDPIEDSEDEVCPLPGLWYSQPLA